MHKLYRDYNEFIGENHTLSINIKKYTKPDCHSYIVKVYNDKNETLYLVSTDGILNIIGNDTLICDAAKILYDYKLMACKIKGEDSIVTKFIEELQRYYRGDYTKLDGGMYQYNMYYKTLMLAGGCFWCMAKPYNEYDGVIDVLSGYAGGHVIDPTYKEVKGQTTGHKEVVRITYDSNVISYKELLTIYFESINPFDDGGQFIDRGESYTTAVFSDDLTEREVFTSMKNEIEKSYNQTVCVRLLHDDIFYMAEEYHQDYAMKNEEAFKHEEEISGRLDYEYIKL